MPTATCFYKVDIGVLTHGEGDAGAHGGRSGERIDGLGERLGIERKRINGAEFHHLLPLLFLAKQVIENNRGVFSAGSDVAGAACGCVQVGSLSATDLADRVS